MIEREARKVLLRAIEGGAFDDVKRAYLTDDVPEDFLAKVAESASRGEAVRLWDDFLTRLARERAEEILGEPYDFPSWATFWQNCSSTNEDPLWAMIFDAADYEAGDGI